MPKRLNLLVQALRGLSVLGVILYHAYPNEVPKGYLGVNVFFVISGFLIYPRIHKIFPTDEFSIKKAVKQVAIFFTKRAQRLLPAYSTMLVGSIIAIVFLGNRSDWSRIGKLAAFSLAGLGNFGAYKYAGDYFHPNPNPLIHLWSLAVEEQIYIWLPVLFLIGTALRVKMAIMNFLILLLGISSFLLFVFRAVVDERLTSLGLANAEIHNFSYYMVYSHFWQFLLGGFVGLYPHYFVPRYKRNFPKVAFLALTILLLGRFQMEQTISVILAVLLTTYLIFNLSPKTLIPLKPLIYIGDRSYSIYLVHLPIFYLSISAQDLIKYPSNQSLMSLLAIFVSLASGAILHKFVEEKYRYQ